jgi:hypothetical protein
MIMLTRVILSLCIALAVTAAPVFAQQPPAKPGAEQPAPLPRPEPLGQPVNIRVELTITDQAGPGEALKKSVTILAADRARASVRNEAGNRGFINVDANPQLLPSGGIRMTLGLEYMPTVAGPGGEGQRTLSRLNEHVTVVLESGKPLVISQAADPTSDRKVTAQVTATVVK